MVLFCVLVVGAFLSPGFGELVSPIYEYRPRLYVKEGNLHIVAATDRNISIKAQGFYINNLDVLPTLTKAHSALKTEESFQRSAESYQDRLNALEQKILFYEAGSKDLGSNASVVSTLSNSNFMILNRRINALRRRVNLIRNTLLRDQCSTSPCRSGGTCINLYGTFACHCPPQWEGPTCEVDVNECTTLAGTDFACQNGATCINTPGSYRCVCRPGFYGIHCHTKSTSCTGSSELCGHGICVPQNNDFGYSCICDAGWTTDAAKTSPACNVDVDECKLNHKPCSTNPLVQCINLPGSFVCGSCPNGYTGNGFYCADIDECAFFNGGCSMNPKVQCINTMGSRICGLCPPGYVGNGVQCTYQGVCNVNNGGCHPLAQCRNNPAISSTFVECTCPAGYIGSGIGPTGCTSVSARQNPCSTNPCKNGICSISTLTDNFICICNRGYTGRTCDTAVNPCEVNRCLNGGTCKPILTYYSKCICRPGFHGRYCQNEEQACGGRLTEEEGVLKYPASNFTTYNHRTSCAWTIETNSTKVLKLTFTHFNIEDSVGCRYDWLQIHDGRNSAAHTIGRFCGTQFPNNGTITTTHNIVYLWFRTDRTVAKTGFQLNWTTVDPECGKVMFVNSHGSIQSPGSPGNYPLNRDCTWMLVAPLKKRLLFNFFSLMIGNDVNCDHDYLEFFSNENSRFAKFCNSSHPAPIYSPGHLVNVHFHSDNVDTYPGFQLTYSVVEGVPGCGGVYTSSVGEIHSPTLNGEYPPDLSCEYRISMNLESRIKITFLSFEIEESQNCKFDYVSIHEGADTSSPLVGRYCGTVIPAPYISNGNVLTILFKTDWATSHAGFRLKFETVCGGKYIQPTGVLESPNYPAKNEDGLECVYEIIQKPGNIIELEFSDLNLDTGGTDDECLFDYVEVRDGENGNSTLLGKYCKDPVPTIMSTNNYLWVLFKSVRGPYGSAFKANYSTQSIGCGGILKETVGTIQSPGSTDIYPEKSSCTWVISAPKDNVIQLTWLKFQLEQSFDCHYDNVKVFDNNTGPGLGGLMGKFCGNTLPPTLLSSSNLMTIVFQSDSSMNVGGFLAAYSFIHDSQVCGGNYFTPAGVLKSPQYPGNYPIDKKCVWKIMAKPGTQIMLNVTDFNIESYVNCRYDWLEIRNGGTSSSPLIGRYCGKKIPKLIPSHANQIYLEFNSDMTKTGHGFLISWTTTTTGCGGTLSSPTGSIISPHYPEPYAKLTDCYWKITTSAGSFLRVIFTDLDLEKHSLCLLDYVQLFDGLKLNSKRLGKFCMPTSVPFVDTSKNQLLVQFRSDISFSGRGFQLQYTTVCKNTVTGFSGYIESPNYPNPYPSNQNCEWIIEVSPRNKINITFSHFDIAAFQLVQNKTCQYDYLEIYASDEESLFTEEDLFYNLYGRYCMDKVPETLISLPSDKVKIKFVTDNYMAGTGFRLEWKLFGCGGVLTKPEGTIQSPNYPNGYPGGIHCKWEIEVDYDKSIQFNVTYLDVEKQEPECNFDSVTFYHGREEDGKITSICHQTKPTIVTSNGHVAVVKFAADVTYHGKGFSISYKTIEGKCGGKLTANSGKIISPNYPQNYPKNTTCEWLIEVEEQFTIQFEFEDLDLYKDADNYVKVYDGPYASFPLIVSANESAPNGTFKSSYNQIYVEFKGHRFLTAKGFMMNYHKACGARIVTATSGNIQLNSHDLSLGYGETCNWIIVSSVPGERISLTINHLYSQQGYCYDDYMPIIVYNGETAESPKIGKYCSDKIPPTLYSEGSAMMITLTEKMEFFATYAIVDDQCGGTLQGFSGTFSTPGYPDSYAKNTRCEWLINVSPGHHVTLTFSEFELLESEHCNTDYLEIRKTNASGELLGVFCGNNMPSNITHLGSIWLLYKGSNFTSPDVSAKGFLAEFNWETSNVLSGAEGIITNPFYPKGFLPSQEISWRIVASTGKYILITFLDFSVELYSDDSCVVTSMEFYDGPDASSNSLKSICAHRLPDPIKSSSNQIYFTISYTSNSNIKFKLKWTEINRLSSKLLPPKNVTGCGSTEVISLQNTRNFTLTSPGFPNGYAPNLHCEWIFSTAPRNHLTIYFSSMRLYAWSKWTITSCSADRISLYEMRPKDNDWKLIKTLCDTTPDVIRATNMLKVVFTTNSYINGTGFAAEIKEECGGELTGPTGYISFDNSSARSNDCSWNVTVRPGRTIKIEFLDLHLGTQCINNIWLRNGIYSDSPFLGNGKYCGDTDIGVLTTTSNSFNLRYNGQFGVTFRLRYEEVSIKCGQELSLESLTDYVEISSPNYPNIPNPYSECVWTIRAPPGETLRIDFVDRFDLLYSEDCQQEYVEVRNGATELSDLIGRYCTTINPNSGITKDNMLYVKYFTNNPSPRNGFKANITIDECGGTIRGLSGVIHYKLEHTSGKLKNCTWYLIGLENTYLSISFEEFSISPPVNCTNTNRLILSETLAINNETTTLGTFCGRYPPRPINSTFHVVKVELININMRLMMRGFKLKFNAITERCGGTINAEFGTITSPQYPLSLHRVSCRWQIIVPKGRRVTLSILDFDLDKQALHFDQGLSVFDGRSFLYALKLLKLGDKLSDIESSDNMMTVFFWSTTTDSHRGFKARFTSDKPTRCVGDFTQPSGTINSIDLDLYMCTWNRFSNIKQTVALTIDINTNNTREICYSIMSKLIITTTKKEIKLCSNMTQKVVRIVNPLIKLSASKLKYYSLNFTVFYQVHQCGGVLHTEYGTISSPNFPKTPNKKYECAWLIKLPEDQAIKLSVDVLNLGSNCDNHYLEIYNGGSSTSPRIGKYCRTSKPDVIISGSSQLWLEYKFESYSEGTGFNLTYEPVISGCGGTFHDKTRVIQTPGYKDNKDYPPNAECVWEINGRSGYSLILNFIDRFFIEDTPNCADDFVEVLDFKNKTWNSLGKFCGRNVPQSLQSTGEKMKIMFRSGNDSVTGAGFRAQWSSQCGGTFEATDEPQYITSPGYPFEYEPLLKCVYNIKNPAKVINLHFEDFELEQGNPDCKYDNLTVKGRYSTSVSTFCNMEKPGDLRIKDLIIVEFKTDRWLNRKGFKFMYKNEVCGGSITSPGLIESPDLEVSKTQSTLQYVSEIVTCQWKIEAPSDKIVVLRLQSLKVPALQRCLMRSLTIYKEFNKNYENKLAVFCGDLSKHLPVVVSPTNHMYLVFTYNTGVSKFSAEVDFTYGPSVGCGGNIDVFPNASKLISSPNNLANLDCHWLISAPDGDILRIRMKKINLLPCESSKNRNTTDSCECNFIEIRDGAAPYSNLVEKICSNSNSEDSGRVIITNGRYAYVRYFANSARSDAFEMQLVASKTICGTVELAVTEHVQTLSSPQYPSAYPSDIRCVWKLKAPTSRDKIVLHFNDFDLMEENGTHITSNLCSRDKLVISDDDQSSQLISQGLGPNAMFSGRRPFMMYNSLNGNHEFCGKNEKIFDFYSMRNTLTLTFTSGNDKPHGKGFLLEYMLAGCDRNYTSEQGRLLTYQLNNSCVTTLTVPENYTISLYFKLFIIMDTDNCRSAGMEIRDGILPTSPLLSKVCGFRLPDPIFSTGNKLWIKTWTSPSVPKSFIYDVTYTSSPKGKGCGGELYNYRGIFTSPLYPQKADMDADCIWNVRVPLGLKLGLRFTVVDFIGDCTDNYLMVTTYVKDIASEHKYCGTDNPAFLHSDNRVTVKYSTTKRNMGKGFRALFQTVSDDSNLIY